MSEQNPNGMARDAAERATGAVADTVQGVKDVAADAAAKTQEFARETGRQASAAAQNLYGQGNDLVARLDRTVVENPLTSILVAGIVGFGLGWALQRR